MFAKSKLGWTLDTLFLHVIALMEEHEKAVKAALASSELANTKAETNADRWRSASNEWRQAMDDREVKFMPREEYRQAHNSMMERLGVAEARIAANENRGVGLKQGWGFLVGALGAAAGVIGIFLALKGR